MFFVKGKESENISHTLRFDGGCAPTNPGPCAGSYAICFDGTFISINKYWKLVAKNIQKELSNLYLKDPQAAALFGGPLSKLSI